MRARRFHIHNYRCIRDSGWVSIENVTLLVGKNESGKTAVLEALNKFFSDEELEFTRKDFPRALTRQYTPEAVCVEVEFSLEKEDKKELAKIIPELAGVDSVCVSKSYENLYSFDLRLPTSYVKAEIKDISVQLRAKLTGRLNSSDSFDQELYSIIDNFLNSIAEPDADLSDKWRGTKGQLDAKSASSPQAAEKVTNLVRKGDEEVAKAEARLNAEDRATDKILELMPNAVYFEHYDIIRGKVNLQEFASAKESGPLKGHFKTMNNLLTMAELDVEALVKLGESGDAESRKILCYQASIHVTGRTSRYWSQREYQVTFDVDGAILSTYVSDDVDKSPIALEDRSKGFQTQFSFNVNFSTVTRSELKGALLLLDEPGVHLHAAAQADLLRLIEDLSKDNQIIYATHSPFMIDVNHLERVRMCREEYKKNVPQVSEQYWKGERDSIFPLLSALGYDLSQSLFIGKQNLILEGITDFWYLTSISGRLNEMNREGLKDKITISPVGGATKVYYMAVLMSGQNLDVVALLDSETEGRNVKDDLVKNRILKDRKVLLVSETVDPAREMDLEDLIPEDFYLSLVEESYRKELGDRKITLPRQRPPRIVSALDNYFTQIGVPYHKTRPARLFLTRFPTLQNDKIPADLLDNFEKLIKSINELFPR